MEHRMTNQVLDPVEEQIAGCMGWGDLSTINKRWQVAACASTRNICTPKLLTKKV
jgi:hypothetical protein